MKATVNQDGLCSACNQLEENVNWRNFSVDFEIDGSFGFSFPKPEPIRGFQARAPTSSGFCYLYSQNKTRSDMFLVISSSIRSIGLILKAPRSISKRVGNSTAHLANPFVRSIHDQPMRILFCGADELSIVSLEALHKESQRSSSHVASIDVVCRPGKPAGRGLKQIRHRMSPPKTGLIELTYVFKLPSRVLRKGWDFPSTKLTVLLGGR